MTTKKDYLNKHLSPAKKAWITRKIKGGKSKYQIAEELNLSPQSVYYWTKGIPSKNCGWPGIRGKTLDMLRDLVTKGFIVPSGENVHQQFLTLRKYFPTVYRIRIYNKQIILLKGKEDVAVRAFLENTRKKIISYQELKRVTEVFGADLSKKEKEAFLFKKQGDQWVKNHRVQREVSLRENDDSFSFFYIRRYCQKNSFVFWFFFISFYHIHRK